MKSKTNAACIIGEHDKCPKEADGYTCGCECHKKKECCLKCSYRGNEWANTGVVGCCNSQCECHTHRGCCKECASHEYIDDVGAVPECLSKRCPCHTHNGPSTNVPEPLHGFSKPAADPISIADTDSVARCTGCYIGGDTMKRTDNGAYTHQLNRYPHPKCTCNRRWLDEGMHFLNCPASKCCPLCNAGEGVCRYEKCECHHFVDL